MSGGKGPEWQPYMETESEEEAHNHASELSQVDGARVVPTEDGKFRVEGSVTRSTEVESLSRVQDLRDTDENGE